LVNLASISAPVISSLPCFHEEHHQLLDSLEVIIKSFLDRVEGVELQSIPTHLAPLIVMNLEKVLKGFSQIQGAPLKLQAVLESLAALSKNLETDPQDGHSAAHVGVQCDNCNVVPIVGNRYKCLVCHNFDLCEACESSGVHPQNHELIKFKVVHVPTFGFPVGRRFGHCHAGRARRWNHSQCARNRRPQKYDENKEEFDTAADSRLLGKEHGVAFVKDVNIEDKTHIGRGQFHVKTWSVRNNGNVDWDNSVKLVYLSGDREILIDAQDQFDVPLLKISEIGDVNVPFITPNRAGTYKTVFSFTRNGKEFGQHLWVEFVSE